MTQVTSAAKADFSERTGRRLEKGGIAPSQRPKKQWRRQPDPFAGVWDEVIVPLLEESPFLTGVVVLEHLQELYPGQYLDKHLRCLQERIKKWKAIHGPEKEVMFKQMHPPGLRGISDFTKPKAFHITIQGKPLIHLLYHFRLTYSRWMYVKVILGGESFPALAQGLQEALTRLGGSPREHRTDSLSAAFKNLSNDDCNDITGRYGELCAHYRMIATRNNRGKGHENGSVEAAHGYLKRRLRQALALRGSYDFASLEEYQRFIDIFVERHNRRHAPNIEEEKGFLKPLPMHKACDFEDVTVRVTTFSTIMVKGGLYTVPSSLKGERLRVHIYDRHLSCYLGGDHVLELPRILAEKGEKKRCVDYRHLIGSLSIKPQAFRYSVLRDDLLPTAVYKAIWRLLDERCRPRQACKLMVGLLKLAADYDCEQELGEKVLKMLRKGVIPSLGDLARQYAVPLKRRLPFQSIPQHSLAAYNQLLSSAFRESTHA
jgi:hypothetical protein